MKSIGWKKICCPVDFSPESRAAAAVAADLCRRLGAELTLLHVEDTAAAASTPATGAAAPPAGDESPAWRREAEAAGAHVATATTRGDPRTAIAAYADQGGFDAIVMGTHGRTGRAHALVGSVAESTVRNARCPVMVVHADWAGVK